jgi:hypothetical protein
MWEEEDNVEERGDQEMGRDVGPTCKKYRICPMVSFYSLKSQTSCLKLLINCCLKVKLFVICPKNNVVNA